VDGIHSPHHLQFEEDLEEAFDPTFDDADVAEEFAVSTPPRALSRRRIIQWHYHRDNDTSSWQRWALWRRIPWWPMPL